MQSSRAVKERLARQYPYQATINDYINKMKLGLAPRPEKIKGASWVDKPGLRTFGFSTQQELDIFIEEWQPE